MKSTRFFLSLVFSLVLAAASAFAADPSGQWKWTATGPGGRSVDATLDLKVTDGKVSGKVTNRMGAEDIENAKLTGDTLSFTVTRKARNREFIVNYEGKVEGDTIKGTMSTTGREDKAVKVEWLATRAK